MLFRSMKAARDLAQQKETIGTRLLYFYTDESIGPKAMRHSDVLEHTLEAVISDLLGRQPRELP